MSLRESIRSSNGVINYINKFETPQPERKSYRAIARHLNDFIREFGKEYNIKMVKNNSPKYKGSFDPFSYNCIAVQANWKKFANWMDENYNRK